MKVTPAGRARFNAALREAKARRAERQGASVQPMHPADVAPIEAKPGAVARAWRFLRRAVTRAQFLAAVRSLL